MRPTTTATVLRHAWLACAAALLAGCTTLSPDGGMNDVSAMVGERAGAAVRRTDPARHDDLVRDAVRQALAGPLTAESAVALALLNNRGLQASLAELGMAEADLVQAGWMRNPGFSFSRIRGGHDTEIERAIDIDLAGLLTLPWRSGIEKRRFAQAKLHAAAQAVRLATDARKAWIDAVAAQQAAHYMEQVAEAADASLQLAQRMKKAGNWSALDQAREQAFHAEATAQVARARHNAVAARERLARVLGLADGHDAVTLPDRLPDLPKDAAGMSDLETRALQRRFDVLMARQDAEATAAALGLTRATRVVNVLELGYANVSETHEPRANGYEIHLELPLFDWGGAKTAKAEAIYMQALHRTADVAQRARSEVREAHSAWRATWDVARRYRDDIVPLRRKISEEVLLRYNGMLIGVFELLADAREQIGAVSASIEAQREFWNADADLRAAIDGTGATGTTLRASAPAASRPDAH